MRYIFLMLLVFPFCSFAQVFKCENSGSITYTSVPCSSGSTSYDSSRLSGSDIVSDGEIVVYKNASGVFPVSVNILGRPFEMLVDTGATYTSVSARVGSFLGINSCAPEGTVGTFNGQSAYCSVTVDSLSIGVMQFSNIPLKVFPTLSFDGVLGNDFLSRFDITSANGIMRLKRYGTVQLYLSH